jgi:hypothetical protein
MGRGQSRADGGAVKWLLAAGLLRKVLGIAKSYLVNELDLRDWMSQSAIGNFRDGRDEVWFDYIADTGDNELVMRTLSENFRREFPAGTLGPDHPTLPVGAFLFVGGDTAYHVSDESTLRSRFVTPMNASLPPHGRAVRPREIFAIPGNHDYYDNLVGFNRLFRRPYPGTAQSVLPLTGFRSVQEASYIKILLPHGWQLWGADVGKHGLDYRQRVYFREGERPQRLILCTPTPPVALDRVTVPADPADAERKAFLQLLDPSPESAPETLPVGFDPAFTPDSGGQLPPPGHCRLHLGGDTHHYARYSGHADPADRTPASVATVVSGGGGAFTHPTEHSCGPVAAAVRYPAREASRTAIAATLVNPFAIMCAGILHVVGAGLALLFQRTWPDRLSTLQEPAVWLCCLFVSLAVAAGSFALTKHLVDVRVKLGKRARRAWHAHAVRAPAQWISQLAVFIAPAGLVAAIAVPITAHRVFPMMDPLSSPSVWLVSAAAVVVALVLLGSLLGATDFGGGPPRLGFGLLGLAHAAMQLALPYSMIQHGWSAAGIVIAAIMVVFPLPARAMYRRAPAPLITALWLLQGLGAIAALWWCPWPAAQPAPEWTTAVLALVVGGIIAPMQFGFYVLTCSAWNGHNNEAGISARLTSCKQWIRFHVAKDALTGYVIGIDDPTAHHPVPRLIDSFVIAPDPGDPH